MRSPRDGFRIRERLRFLGVALQIAQRRRRHGVGGRDLGAGAAQDRVAAVAEPRARLHALQIGERLIQRLARLGRLVAELLRDALDVCLEGLELLLQIVLALGELLGLIVGQAAAAPRCSHRRRRCLRSASCKSFATWRCSS